MKHDDDIYIGQIKHKRKFVTVPAKIGYICDSCIMYQSDLPDMYTQARGPSGLRAWVYISGKSRGHVIQLISK